MRKRLEESSRAKKAKKGFLTPERKKKLRASYFFPLSNSFFNFLETFDDEGSRRFEAASTNGGKRAPVDHRTTDFAIARL